MSLENVEVRSISSFYSVARFDLSFDIYENEKGIGISIDYATDLFGEKTLERLVGHFKEFVQAIVKDPSQCINTYAFLTSQEQHQLLIEWNDTKADYPKEKSIHQLFEEQVSKTPNNIAVVYKDQELTYQQLNEKANQLAHYLRNIGVGPDTLVAIAVERSLEMVVGLLGILKAGGAYVPLDSTYPQERLQFMLEDTNAPVLITQSSLKSMFKSYPGITLALDDNKEIIERESKKNLLSLTSPHHLAYVIYTSGSTGKPKGVMIENNSFLNHMLWMKEEYGFSYKDTVLQKTACSFDASVWEFFLPLISGSKIILATPYSSKDFKELSYSLLKHKVTALQLVPSALIPFLQDRLNRFL